METSLEKHEQDCTSSVIDFNKIYFQQVTWSYIETFSDVQEANAWPATSGWGVKKNLQQQDKIVLECQSKLGGELFKQRGTFHQPDVSSCLSH